MPPASPGIPGWSAGTHGGSPAGSAGGPGGWWAARRTRTKAIIVGVVGLLLLSMVGSALGTNKGNPSGSPQPSQAEVSASTGTSPSAATASPSAAPVTPAPSSTPELTPTPEPPSPSPAPAFGTIKLSGRGDSVAKFTIPQDQPGLVTFTNRGSANFVVLTLNADGSEGDLLVNTIGNYAGTTLFDTASGSHSVAFKITSDGPWTATIKPVTAARTWDGSSKLTGKGDDVVQVDPPISGLVSATITHSGTANFVVYTYSSSGQDIVVNEIGNYSGVDQLGDGTLLVQVLADGSWTITPQ